MEGKNTISNKQAWKTEDEITTQLNPSVPIVQNMLFFIFTYTIKIQQTIIITDTESGKKKYNKKKKSILLLSTFNMLLHDIFITTDVLAL